MSLATLQTALDNLDAKIADFMANPKPNYSINGQSVQWGDFMDQLFKSRQSLLEQINLASGPDEVVIEGIT